MKLVDILARELKEWKSNADGAVFSSKGGACYFFHGNRPAHDDHCWRATEGCFWFAGEKDKMVFDADTPEDHATAIVTRAQWQEARKALSTPAKHGAPMPPISEAPKDATHWDPGYDSEPTWACKMGGVWNWHPVNGAPIDSGWRVYPFQGDSLESRLVLIERPWNGEGLPPVGPVEYLSNDGWRAGECLAVKDGYAVVWVNCGNVFAISEHDKGTLRPIRTPEQIAAEERKLVTDDIQRVCVDGENNGIPFHEALYDAGYRKVNDGNQKA
jgi:hypothetical protein